MKRIILLIAIFAITLKTYSQYCSVSVNFPNDEHISRVQIGSIDNESSWAEYSDFTSLSSFISPGQSVPITITNGPPNYSGDQCGIWVDWNNNYDFTDDPHVTVTGSPSKGPYTGMVTCPSDQEPGEVRMRIRIIWTGTLSPCDNSSYGETEDYTLKVIPTPDHDIYSIAILPVQDFSTSSSITVSFGNSAETTEQNIEVSYQINNGPVITEILPQLPGNSTVNYTFNTKADLSETGEYHIKAWCDLPNDELIENDTVSAEFANIHEVGIYGFFSPSSMISPSFTDKENITVYIANNGTQNETDFKISYQINNGKIITETFLGSLAKNSVNSYTFSSKADLSVTFERYTIKAWISVPDDINHINDTIVSTAIKTSGYCINNLGGGSTYPQNIQEISITGTLFSNNNHNNTIYSNNSIYGCYPVSHATGSMVIGRNYELNVTTSNNYIISAWIDFDHNLVFDDYEWTQIAVNSTPYEPSSASIHIPETALSGNTFMRIRTRGTGLTNGAIDACTNFGAGIGITEDYIINLEMPKLSVSPLVKFVPAEANSTDFSVGSNTEWTALSDQLWCTVTPDGTENGTITADYTENTGLDIRTAIITVSAAAAEDRTVSIVQMGGAPVLILTCDSKSVPDRAGSVDIGIGSNINWTAVSNQTWCSVTPSGSGISILNVTYTENTASTPRTASIIISGEISDTITIIQSGALPYIEVTPLNTDVTQNSGSIDLAVTSNRAWTASSNKDWCTVTPSGNGNGTITATFTGNTGNRRTALIKVSVDGGGEQTIILNQNGIPVTSGLDNKNIISDLLIYPAVCKDMFNIHMSNSEKGIVEVSVINIQGITIKKLQFNKNSQSETFEVQMGPVAKGLYLIDIKLNGCRQIKRIVVE